MFDKLSTNKYNDTYQSTSLSLPPNIYIYEMLHAYWLRVSVNAAFEGKGTITASIATHSV